MALADPEASLAIRAVWLHYAGGLTQSAVAERLGIPSVKAHRLIARAVADGVVKVSGARSSAAGTPSSGSATAGPWPPPFSSCRGSTRGASASSPSWAA